MSQLFASGGQIIGVSASTSVLPMNIQEISFRIVWIDLLAVQGTLKSLHHYYSLKASILGAQFSLWYSSQTSIHDCWKNCSFDYTDFCQKSDVFIF